MKKESNEYWYCIIGPVQTDKLPWGSDGPLRAAVKETYFGMFPGTKCATCSSGWGVTSDAKDAMSFATCDDELKAALIGSYHNEGKRLPRHMRAWELLFAEEAKGKAKTKTKSKAR